MEKTVWKRLTMMPTMSETASIGAASLAATSIAWTPMCMMSVSFTVVATFLFSGFGLIRRTGALEALGMEGAHQGLDHEVPAVGRDEEQELERQGNQYRRQHHHSE